MVDQFFNASTGESQYGESDFVGPWNHGNGLVTVESEIKGGTVLMWSLTIRNQVPKTSPIDSTPVGEYTNGVGEKQAALHDKANAKAAKNATVEV